MLSRCDAVNDSIHDMVSAATLQTCCKGSSNAQEVNMVVWRGLIGIVT